MSQQAIITVAVPSVPPLPAHAIFAHYTVEDAADVSYPRSVNALNLADAVRHWVEMGTVSCDLRATAYDVAEDHSHIEYHTRYDGRTGTWSDWSTDADDSTVPLGTDAEYDAAPITTELLTK
jgi:hypothetical protein